MDLMETPLGDEVRRIVNAAQGNPGLGLDVMVHTESGDVEAIRVLNYDLVRDYVQQYSDEISIVIAVPAGKSAYKIMPSRNNLEITITGAKVTPHGPTALEERGYASQRFRAVLKQANDPTLEANSRELLSEYAMDMLDFQILEFQLFSKAMEQFSVLSCGGIYRQTKTADLIRSLLLEETQKIDVEDDYKPKGVDMVDPVDNAAREHIVIPHGTKVYDAPGYIHRYCGGVYSAGLSYYYQDDYWFVFPTYDYKRFEESERQLVIVQVPENKLPDIDHTYLVEGSVVNIIATGQLKLDDRSDLQKRVSGNGVRFADASKFFEDGVEVAGNKALVSRGKLNNEFISSKQKSEFNNVVLSSDRISANTMYQASKLAAKEGVSIQLIWENSDPSLIRPGMQTKILYFKEGQVRQINAIVIGAHASTAYEGRGIVSGRYNRNTALHLFAANEAQQ
jgi:hypothetical protein